MPGAVFTSSCMTGTATVCRQEPNVQCACWGYAGPGVNQARKELLHVVLRAGLVGEGRIEVFGRADGAGDPDLRGLRSGVMGGC